MTLTQEHLSKGEGLLTQLVTKSWEDESFKEQLISNPHNTIESLKFENLNIPSDFKIIVEDQTDTSKIYINISKKADLNNIELSDEQLEMVAGGIGLVVGAAAVVGLGILFIGAVGLGITIYNQATKDD